MAWIYRDVPGMAWIHGLPDRVIHAWRGSTDCRVVTGLRAGHGPAV